jgi:glycosyltransferase involved in cell wall biosynthesis
VPPFVDVGASDRAWTDPVGTDGLGGDRSATDGLGPEGPGRRRNTAGTLDGTRWLFVGKLLPHKGAHEVVKAFAAYRSAFDPTASLTLVGGHPIPAYTTAVREYVAALGLEGAVHLPGTIDDHALRGQYRQADVFVCLSDHEGFCFPLLEAMHHDVPVVCADAGALPDTAGSAALVLGDRSAGAVATAVHRVIVDGALRARLTTAGRARVTAFDLQRTAERFVLVVRQAWARLRPSGPVP